MPIIDLCISGREERPYKNKQSRIRGGRWTTASPLEQVRSYSLSSGNDNGRSTVNSHKPPSIHAEAHGKTLGGVH